MMMDVDIILRQQAVHKGLSFAIEYEYPLPTLLVTDRLRLTQVLVNVIGNAIKFTETGSVTIKVSYREAEGNLQFTIVDTGIGIDTVDHERIFEAFEQGESGIAKRYEGIGLGLSIAKTIMRLLGGSIQVESCEEKGSTFTVSHPYKKTDDNEFVTELPILSNDMSTLQTATPVPRLKGKVLLVEDGRMLQLFTMKLLQRMGIEAVLANNGFEAIKLAEGGDFDVVLMDLQMPVMDGFTATRKLIAQGYTKPIIALTASVTKEEASSCFEARCVDFLSKPFDRDEFYRLLSRYIQEELS